MLWLTVEDSLPQASTAFHVTVLVYVPAQAPGVVLSDTSTTEGLGSQASIAKGAVNTGAAGQSIIASGPGDEITGAVVSTTVKVAVVVLMLPQASVTVKVTFTAPVVPQRSL